MENLEIMLAPSPRGTAEVLYPKPLSERDLTQYYYFHGMQWREMEWSPAGATLFPISIDPIDYHGVYESLRESLHKLIDEVKIAVAEMRAQKEVSLSSVAPEPYSVIKPIPVHLQPHEGGVIATFFDANISAAGETDQEAFSNLRSLILDTLDSLELEPSMGLGPEPFRQLAVLKEFISKDAG